MIGPESPTRGSAEWWDERYERGDTPWDTGIVPPELVALIESGPQGPGWALDLGCGSGLNSRYLARHGYRVIGVDLALGALSRADAQARAEGLPAYFLRADVADLCFLRLQAAFALDIGCYHNVPPPRRATYAASLADHLLPGAYFLLYAFRRDEAAGDASSGVVPADLALFAPAFTLCRTQHGLDGERASAWYLLQRR